MENKKVILPLIAGSCALITIGGATLIALQLIGKENETKKNNDSEETKPLNRGDNYEHVELTHNFMENKFLTNVIDKTLEDNKWVKSIDEPKFQNFMKNNVRAILKSISRFESDADKYEIEINYLIQNNQSRVLFDIVWGLPGSDYHYYDQLKISF
ncbi:MAG: hypothetical protein HUJ52_02435 [Malacoplasma sp.]|nr:hypothetical protein [Malacoplasma sp.]